MSVVKKKDLKLSFECNLARVQICEMPFFWYHLYYMQLWNPISFVPTFWELQTNPLLYLGGGFNYFLFSSLFGEMIQFEESFSNGLKPPTRYQFTWMGRISTFGAFVVETPRHSFGSFAAICLGPFSSQTAPLLEFRYWNRKENTTTWHIIVIIYDYIWL